MDIDRRRLGIEDDTIDFREMSLELSEALTQLGSNSTASSAVEIEIESRQFSANPIVKDTKERKIAGSAPKTDRTFQRESRDVRRSEDLWYDKPIIMITLLLGFFPLGFYGLYRTRRITASIKALMALVWFAAVATCILTFY